MSVASVGGISRAEMERRLIERSLKRTPLGIGSLMIPKGP